MTATQSCPKPRHITGALSVVAGLLCACLVVLALGCGGSTTAASSSTTTTGGGGTGSSGGNGTFTITATDFTNNGTLPADYTCDGTGSTPALSWTNPPSGTEEFALLFSTIPTPGTVKYDWVLYSIPATRTSLPKNSFLVGTVGLGDDGPGLTYDPPCSQGPGAKLYTYTLYALSGPPNLTASAGSVSGATLASAISSLTLGTATINATYSREPTTAPGSSTNCLYIRGSLQAISGGNTYIACDGTYAYISSYGMPIRGTTVDTMMNGITSTNLQLPTPTNFLGTNAWAIPLSATLATSATSVSSGPIGVAVNGVPIFNPCVQSGNCTASSGDTKGEGQLDICNGHAGRADDYHYHAAPTCLMATQPTTFWNTHPVGWMLDGFAIFGYNNADSSVPVRDPCGGSTLSGAQIPSGYPYVYAYHVMNTFPYITDNCMSGVPSPDLAGQSAKYNPMRQPPVTPFDDTNMTLTTSATDGYQVLQFTSPTAFTATETGSDSYPNAAGTYLVRYKQVTGAALTTLLAEPANAGATACWNFEFENAGGTTTQPTVSYCKKNP